MIGNIFLFSTIYILDTVQCTCPGQTVLNLNNILINKFPKYMSWTSTNFSPTVHVMDQHQLVLHLGWTSPNLSFTCHGPAPTCPSHVMDQHQLVLHLGWTSTNLSLSFYSKWPVVQPFVFHHIFLHVWDHIFVCYKSCIRYEHT